MNADDDIQQLQTTSPFTDVVINDTITLRLNSWLKKFKSVILTKAVIHLQKIAIRTNTDKHQLNRNLITNTVISLF